MQDFQNALNWISNATNDSAFYATKTNKQVSYFSKVVVKVKHSINDATSRHSWFIEQFYTAGVCACLLLHIDDPQW